MTSEGDAVKTLFKLRYRLGATILALLFSIQPFARAQAVTTTTVQGIVYRADGTVASGTLIVSWPAFSTALNQAVAAGTISVTIGADGSVSLNLAPNAGASPAGTYYTAIYHLSDGTVSKEYWLVPATATASIASLRAQIAPSNVALQAVTKQYVDSAIAAIGGTGGSGAYIPTAGGSMTGPLLLSSDPTAPTQAATKHYADVLSASAVALAGGSMTGALQLSGTPNSSAPGTQAANTGLVRAVAARSVLEFGAKCDGVTDDRAAFQTALTASASGSFGLIFPVGTCYIATPLQWAGQSMKGLGQDVSFLKAGTGQDLFELPDYGSLGGNPIQKGIVSDFTIILNDTTNSSQWGNATYNRPAGFNTVMAPNQPGYTTAALPAWQVGNCAFAMPAAGPNESGLNGTQFERLTINNSGPNHVNGSCGFWMQSLPYNVTFKDIHIGETEFGIVEALPGSQSSWATFLASGWSSDTNKFENLNITSAVGLDLFARTDLNLSGINIYARGKYQSPGCTDGHSTGLLLEQNSTNVEIASLYIEPGCLNTNAVLTANIGATDTSIAVSDIRQFSTHGGTVYISISPAGGEWVNYNGIAAGTAPAGTLTGVTRGAMGTIATAHVGTGGAPEQVNIPADQIAGTQINFHGDSVKQGTGGILVWSANNSKGDPLGIVGQNPYAATLQVLGSKNTIQTFGVAVGDVLDAGTGNSVKALDDTNVFNAATPAKYLNPHVRPLPNNKLTADWLNFGGHFFQSLDDLLFTPEQLITPSGIGGSFLAGGVVQSDATAPVSGRFIYVPSGTAVAANRFAGTPAYLTAGQILPYQAVAHLWTKGESAASITVSMPFLGNTAGRAGTCSVLTSWSECTIPMDFSTVTAGQATEIDIAAASVGIEYSAVAIAPNSNAATTASVNAAVTTSVTGHIAHVCIEDYLTVPMAGDYAQGYNAAVQAQSLITPTEVRACVPGNHPWGTGGAGGVVDRPIVTDFSGSTMVVSSGLSSTPVTVTGTVTVGSLTVPVSTTTGLAVNQHIGGTGLLPDTIITAVNTGASTITLSQYPLLVVTGMTSASTSVSNLSSVAGLATGETVTGLGIPAATTILTLDTSGYGLTLSAPTTVSSTNGQALTVSAGSWSVPLTAIAVKKALRYTYNAGALHNYQGQMIGGEIRNVWFTDPGYRTLAGVAGLQVDAWDTLPINHLRIDNIAGSEFIVGGSDGANVVRESDFWGLQLRDGGDPTTGQASLVIQTPSGTVGSDEDNDLRFDGHVVFPFYVGEYIGTANLNHTGTNGPRLIYHTANFQIEGGGRIFQTDGTYANVYIAKPYNLVHINLAGDIYYQGGALNIPGLGRSIFRVDTARYLAATGGRLEPIANGTFLFNVTATSGSPTVTYVSYPGTSAIKSFDFSKGGTLKDGTRVLIGSTSYIVQSVAANGSSLTLTSNYAGTSGATTMTQTDGGYYLNVTNSLISAQTSGYYNDFSAPGLGLAGLTTANYPNLFQGLGNITSGFGFEDYQGRDKRGQGVDVVADSGSLPGLSVGSGANNSSFIGIGGSYALADWRYFAGFGGGQAIMQASYQKNLCLMLSSPSNTFAVGTCVLQLTNTTNAVTTPQTTLDDGSGNSIFARTTAANFATATNCSSGSSPATCGSAAAGSAIVGPGATSQTVNTTAVGANSQIIVQQDNGLGSRLGVTCYSAGNTNPYITSRVAGTSFTFTVGAPTTNPGCYSYVILNK